MLSLWLEHKGNFIENYRKFLSQSQPVNEVSAKFNELSLMIKKKKFSLSLTCVLTHWVREGSSTAEAADGRFCPTVALLWKKSDQQCSSLEWCLPLKKWGTKSEIKSRNEKDKTWEKFFNVRANGDLWIRFYRKSTLVFTFKVLHDSFLLLSHTM